MYRFLEYTAQDYMTSPVKSVGPDLPMRELDDLFRSFDYNAIPVVENDRMVGVVTKFDFLRTFAFTTDRMLPPYQELMSRPVGEVMTREVNHVAPATPLTRVLELMIHHRARSLPVVDESGKLAGMISREDLMRALEDATKD
jgi:CBS domain-containing protein